MALDCSLLFNLNLLRLLLRVDTTVCPQEAPNVPSSLTVVSSLFYFFGCLPSISSSPAPPFSRLFRLIPHQARPSDSATARQETLLWVRGGGGPKTGMSPVPGSCLWGGSEQPLFIKALLFLPRLCLLVLGCSSREYQMSFCVLLKRCKMGMPTFSQTIWRCPRMREPWKD